MKTNNDLYVEEKNDFEIMESESYDDSPIVTKKEIEDEYKKKLKKSVSSYSPEEKKKIQKQMTYDLLLAAP